MTEKTELLKEAEKNLILARDTISNYLDNWTIDDKDWVNVIKKINDTLEKISKN